MRRIPARLFRGFLVGALCLLATWQARGAAATTTNAWIEGAGYRFRPVVPPPPGTPGFTLKGAAETGFAFTNRLAQARYVTNQIHLNGSGVALGDIDGDGWCDIFLAGLDGPNALFRNLGAWKFTNIAEQAGVDMPNLDCSGAALADLDGDRDLDLIVNTVGAGTHVLLNEGHGRFTPAPGSPYNQGRGGMSLALADVDGDGDIDVFVANYRMDTFRDQPGTRFRGKNVDGRMVLQTVNGRPVTDPDLVGRYTILPSGAVVEHGEADVLLRNEGGGRFTAVPLTEGLLLDENGVALKEPIHDWTLSAVFHDANGDGLPDLYLCNDFQDEDHLWLNDGHGHFRRAPAVALRHMSMFSMSADFGDLDRDGIEDLVTADMLSRTHARRQTRVGDARAQFSPPGEITNQPQYAFNQLHRGRGDGTFAEIAWYAGIEASDWTWNLALIDVDLDGFEDVLVSTGNELDSMDVDILEASEKVRARRDANSMENQKLKLMYPRLNLSNFAFRNRGNLTFEEVSAGWRFDLPVVTHGMAAADLDNDGDLDLVLNNLNDPASLLRNDAPAPRLAVRLAGAGLNTPGIGARIQVTGGPVPQAQEIMGGGRYLSSDAPMRVFATGSAKSLKIEVRWRNGRTCTIADALPNHEYEIREAGSIPPSPTAAVKTAPLFADASALLAHRHVDEPFDDFAVQTLLPGRLSQLGPGVVWADLDGDGRDDLAIGTGKSGTMATWRNLASGFERLKIPGTVAERDQLGMVAWPVTGGRQSLLVTQANWEDGAAQGMAVTQVATGTTDPALGILPASDSSPGMLAKADVDGDGDLDVFVAGRVIPGRYPEAAASHVLVQRNGRLEPDPAAEELLREVGMVAGATWSDLNDDGFPELVLACDWGPVRVFRNDHGKLSAWDAAVDVDARNLEALGGTMPRTLGALTGCWSGIAAVDLDGDGRLDLVVGNWGRNSRWQLAGDRPLRLYHGDYDENGTDETLEAVFVPELGDYAPVRGLRPVAEAIPFVRAVATTYKIYGESTLSKLLGGHMRETHHAEASVLASVALLNRGDRFELRVLPPPAQWSPVFAVVPADFDGDGREDVFLSQNFFGVHGDAARQDAGRGLLLRGDGTGGFEVWDAPRSGISIYGEQRGAATADYDADGRPDLVVTQNSNSTVLLHNTAGHPGVRVRLVGGPGNPRGTGAMVRAVFGSDRGPSREVAGGSGWLSENSAVVVLAAPKPVSAIEVHWPGGKRTQVVVPPGATEIEARAP